MITRTFTVTESDILQRVVRAIHAVEPGARVILYGSRARGGASPDSDWDFLALLDGPVDRRRIERVRTALFHLSLALDGCPTLSAMVYGADEWASSRLKATPFHRNVEREGMAL